VPREETLSAGCSAGCQLFHPLIVLLGDLEAQLGRAIQQRREPLSSVQQRPDVGSHLAYISNRFGFVLGRGPLLAGRHDRGRTAATGGDGTAQQRRTHAPASPPPPRVAAGVGKYDISAEFSMDALVWCVVVVLDSSDG
jgi:hypothetical protein